MPSPATGRSPQCDDRHICEQPADHWTRGRSRQLGGERAEAKTQALAAEVPAPHGYPDLEAGPKELVRAPLTAKARNYLKHDKAKTLTVKLTVTVKDPAGNRKTFTRTLTVKRPNQTTRKH
jgi:hypothetical protein